MQQYLLGLKGDIAPNWTFDVFTSYDQSIHDQTLHDAVLKSRVQTLLNASDGGNSLCSGGFNPFGDAHMRAVSQACISYITKNAISQERLGQTQVQGQVNGKLFDLGAGPVQVAVVADYRRNTYSFSPDSDLQTQNIEAVIASLPAAGHISVKEFAAQVDVPLLANRHLIEEFGVGAAVRVSDYSTSGTVTSYEADARWRPVRSLLIRGSYQRAVRAPNIGELYSPQQGVQLVIGTPPGALGDPCDVRSTARTGANASSVAGLCVAQGVPAPAIGSYTFPTTATGQLVSGNTGLTPETANTYNVGFVLSSPVTSGPFADVTFSVDYYSISIKNVISTVPGLTVLSKCYNLDGSNPTYDVNNLYCKLIQRDATGQIVTVATPFLNLGSLKTDGVEAQLSWSTAAPFLEGSGRLFVNSAVGWLGQYKVQLLPGTAFLDYAGISNGAAGTGSVPPRATPRWKALTSFGYRSSLLTAGLRWRYQSAMNDTTAVLTPSTAQVGVPSYSMWDLFGSVRINSRVELRAGVNNLFDKGLPFVASSQNGTDTALYDPVGRSFFVGASAKF